MKNRILLKDVPPNIFHSAIFTTYSINLYYLEQQVLPMLGSKGIHYVSILADSQMLSIQLESLSSMSENKKRTYAIHGIQSKGAFHPKLIFLAGDTSLLLLIGSGNLTSCGHGKNLEVWNSFYVDSAKDSKFGFLAQSWNYLKQIHKDLGPSSLNKIKNIEENCSLLKQSNSDYTSVSYQVDNNSKISFITSQSDKSLFSQLVPIIGTAIIEKITFMTPFYDIEGNLIRLFNDTFKPRAINIILQKEFGQAPIKIAQADNMHFFDWNDVKCDSIQKFFHAKNIVFESKNTNFLLSGSANSSIAAFGMGHNTAINFEACVLYQSNETKYIEVLGIRLNERNTDLSLYKGLPSDEDSTISDNLQLRIFIKSAELNFDTITVQLLSENKMMNAALCIYDAKGNLKFEELIEISALTSRVSIFISQTIDVMYCCLRINSNIVSNKQFIVDINAFESTNPFQKNRSLNQLRKIIENEGFSTTKIIEYLNTIFQAHISKQKIAVSSGNKEERSEIIEEESDLLYIPYQKIQEKIKHFDNIKHGKGYIEYHSVRMWESVMVYLKDSRERTAESIIAEEETEKINKSTGRKDVDYSQPKKTISQAVFDKTKFRIEKFLVDYIKTIVIKIESDSTEKPSIIDLSMYLIMIEILIQQVNSKEILEDNKQEFLLNPEISHDGSSWSGHLLKIIGLFSLWWNKKGGFKDIDSQEYKDKFQRYRTDAFNMSILAISIFGHLNKNSAVKEKINIWVKLELLNIFHSFSNNKINSYLSDDYLMYLNDNQKICMANQIDYELNNNLKFLIDFTKNKDIDSSYSIQIGSGYIFLHKIWYSVISNTSLLKIPTYKLFLQ